MKRYSILFLLILFSFSCADKSTPTIDPPIEEDPVFSLNIDGNKWTPTEYYFKSKGDGSYVIFATDKVYTYSWFFDSKIKEKEYVLGAKENQLISAMYRSVGSKVEAYDILDGKLEIVKYDEDKQILKASFSFNAEYNNKSVEIKYGKIFINKFD